jgi:hypothetical protein
MAEGGLLLSVGVTQLGSPPESDIDHVPVMMWNGLSTPSATVLFTVFWSRRTRGAAPDCS